MGTRGNRAVSRIREGSMRARGSKPNSHRHSNATDSSSPLPGAASYILNDRRAPTFINVLGTNACYFNTVFGLIFSCSPLFEAMIALTRLCSLGFEGCQSKGKPFEWNPSSPPNVCEACMLSRVLQDMQYASTVKKQRRHPLRCL